MTQSQQSATALSNMTNEDWLFSLRMFSSNKKLSELTGVCAQTVKRKRKELIK